MVPIEDAITYPMESDDWITTIIIGGVLTFLSIFILPLFLIGGYLIRVIRVRLDGDPAPPTFGDWGELFVDGLKAFVIYFIYLLVPLIVFSVTVGGAILTAATGGEEGVAAAVAGALGGFLISSVLSIIFGYFAVIGLVNFARQGSFGAAFDVGTVIDVATNMDFLVAFLIALVVSIGFSIVAAIPILGLFVAFYGQIVVAYIWSEGYADATGTSAGADSTSGGKTV
jgi:hypothetical protein